MDTVKRALGLAQMCAGLYGERRRHAEQIARRRRVLASKWQVSSEHHQQRRKWIVNADGYRIIGKWTA